MAIRIWTIGPSGGGKTTLIKGLVSKLGREAYLVDADIIGFNSNGHWRIPPSFVLVANNVSTSLPCMLAGISSNFEGKIAPQLKNYHYIIFACELLTREQLLQRNRERVAKKERKVSYQ